MIAYVRLCALLVLAAGCDDEPARAPVRLAPPAPIPPPPPPAPIPPPPPPVAAPVAEPWVAFSSTAWAFQAEFPTPPTTEVIDLDAALQMHVFVAEVDAEAFLVTVLAGPPEPADSIAARLDRARDGAVANVKGRLAREEQRVHAGHPARRLEISAGPASDPQQIFVLLILREHRLYQALVAGPAAPGRAARAERFFAALRLY